MADKKNLRGRKSKEINLFDDDDIEEISLDDKPARVNKKKKKQIDKKKVYTVTAKTVLGVFIACVLIVGFAVAGLLIGVIVASVLTTEPVVYNPTHEITDNVSYIYNADGTVIAELTGLQGTNIGEWEDIENIPDNLKNAFVAIEDERFYSHNGVDVKRTLSAVAAYFVPGMSSHGGSTITQQVVKNITGNDERSIPRKVREQWSALQFERDYKKDEILEIYMNIIYFANGAYGVQDASQTYFGKDVSKLSLAECAFLAGITNNPGKYNPYTTLGRTNAYKRQINILDAMYNQELITKEEYLEAIQTELVFVTEDDKNTGDTSEGVTNVSSVYSYFVDMVIADVREDLMEEKGISKKEANNIIYNSGIKIYTTQDPDVQKIVDEEYCNVENFPVNSTSSSDPDNAQSAIVIMDQHNGHVIAVYGGYGEKKESLTWNRATAMKRQPGSAIKPVLVYAPLVDMGKITAGYAMDEQAAYLDKRNPDVLWPTNSDHLNHGLVPVRTALNRSYNVFAVELYKGNVKTCLNYLKSLGIDRTEETHLSLALGGFTNGVSPLEMTAAYVPFSNGGVYYEPITYTKVYDLNNDILLDRSDETIGKLVEQLGTEQTKISEDEKMLVNRPYSKISTPSMMTSLLTTVVSDQRSTGYRAQLKASDGSLMPTAGKTGTTSDVKDYWFVGYTPYYTCAVWYGYDNQTVISGSESGAAIKLWQKVMQRIHSELEYKEFETQGSFVTKKICTLSGKLPTSDCWNDPRCSRLIVEETFVAGTQPTGHCDIHTTKNICTAGTDKYGKYYLATSNCKSVTRKTGTYRKSIPEYLIKLDKSDYPEDWSYELSHSYCPHCG